MITVYGYSDTRPAFPVRAFRSYSDAIAFCMGCAWTVYGCDGTPYRVTIHGEV